MMTFERVVKQTIEAIQFDGSNFKEVYDFICEHGGNANEVSFDKVCSRPEEIPLDVNSGTEYYALKKAFNKKWADILEKWTDFKYKNPYEKMENHPEIVSDEFIKEDKICRLYYQDWKEGELYHFYLTDGDYCRMIGICKGDWFVTNGRPIETYSEDGFKMFLEDGRWVEEK